MEPRTASLASDGLRVGVVDFGASLTTVEVADADGAWHHVHLHLPNTADYLDRTQNPHLGASCGRYANRIAGATFPLDGQAVALDANNGPNQLHGGPVGFSRRPWTLAATDASSARLTLHSEDGDQGFPGTLDATATYALDGPTITITYTAVTDAPTVVNLCNHAYWNLAGTGPVRDHRLTLCADDVLPVGPDGIPTGSLTPVAGTPFDFTSARPLGDAIDALGGLDHCYAVRGEPGTVRFAALVEEPASGRWLAVHTDQPGVQAYTGNGLGAPFAPHHAICLEAQRFPDTPNRPDLGTALLLPGQPYTSTTRLTFGTGTPPPF